MKKIKTPFESESGSAIIFVHFGGECWFEDEFGQI